MTEVHLSEEQIQLFALNGEPLSAEALIHVGSCVRCQRMVDDYRALFSAMADQPLAKFDFDISQLVMAQLAQQESPREKEQPTGWIFVLIGAAFAGLTALLCRNYFRNFLKEFDTFVTYVAAVSVLVVASALVLDMLRTYRRRMHTLDVHNQLQQLSR